MTRLWRASHVSEFTRREGNLRHTSCSRRRLARNFDLSWNWQRVQRPPKVLFRNLGVLRSFAVLRCGSFQYHCSTKWWSPGSASRKQLTCLPQRHTPRTFLVEPTSFPLDEISLTRDIRPISLDPEILVRSIPRRSFRGTLT